MKNILLVVFLALVLTLVLSQRTVAGPQSTTYELEQYGFGSGGTDGAGADSSNYTIFGTAGETDNGSADSTSYTTGNGLTYTLQANVPAAPTFTNVASNYDRLKLIIDTGDNPSDAEFAIGISTDNFVTTRYVQSDLTIGASLGDEDWLTYAGWGGASGSELTNLLANTNYKIKVKARHGNFTESGWSAVASASTQDSTLTFSADSAAITFTDLSPGNSYTDSSKTSVLTTSTNAYNGYVVYGRVTQPLTSGAQTIANYASPNSAPTTWSGSGFGYTTDDSSLTGGTANRFTSGGPKYAGFGTSTPGDPVADHVGPITTPISNESFTISYRVTGTQTTQAGRYTSTVVYTVVPSY